MKKIFSVILCVLVLLTSVAFCITAADDSLSFVVATDLHYVKTPSIASVNFPDEKYYCADTTHTMTSISKAIIKQFLREVEASDAQFVLLCGDLVNDGTVSQHRDMVKLLNDFEKQTGKPVFVINGNHDFNAGIAVQTFKDLYAAQGYDEALTVDDETCSYTVDLNSRYRLMALDTCNHKDGNDGVTAKLLAWADEQVLQAKKDGKQLIVMQHHNFLEHIPMQSKLMSSSVLRPVLDMKTHYLNWNVRYVFSGHTHIHDMMAYTDPVGRRVYEIATASLSAYPCVYRTCTLSGDGMDVKTVRMQGVNTADLPRSGYTEELLAELTGDLNTYAYGCFRLAFIGIRASYFNQDALRKILAKFGNSSVQALIDACYPVFYRTLMLPIYEKDADGGESLQAYGEKLGLHFPQTDKKIFFDSLYYFIATVYNGGEHLPYNDDEIVLAVQCAYTALYTAAQTLQADQREQLYADILKNFKDTALPLTVANVLKAALGVAKSERALEKVILIASPFIEMFSMDDETPDHDAFLPDADGARTTFFTQVADFFRTLFAYIRRYCKGIWAIYFPTRSTAAAV